MSDQGSSDHYVYLYRDEKGRPRYVGYGARPTRATSHLSGSHNQALNDFLDQKSKFSIEVAGPFDRVETGLAVETALISALNPDFNVAPGSSTARFRPIGVPHEYADRLSLPGLNRKMFFEMQGPSPGPVLLVKVGDQDFDDGRIGYNPANPPNDQQILERVEKWWQLQNRFVPRWIADPGTSPTLMVGVNGAPGAQVIVAAMLVDRAGWNSVETFPDGEGKIRVPTLPTPELDAFKLRGRKIEREAGIAFDGITPGFFVLLHPDGSVEGSRRTQRTGA